MIRRTKSRKPTDQTTKNAYIDRMVQSFNIDLDPATSQVAPNWSIYKVPTRLRRANPDAYTPHIVTIGPLHHGKPTLSAMEEQKRQYMTALFARTGKHKSDTLRCCTKTIFDLEREARNCYSGGVNQDEYHLAEILLVDGCFIIELFIRFYVRRFIRTKLQDRILPLFHRSTQSAWFANDPIFRSEWLLSIVQRDLALLENQIPFFVLQTLFDTVLGHWRSSLPYDFLAGLAFDFFEPAIHSRRMVCRAEEPLHRKHLLNLLLNFYLPSSPKQGPHRGNRTSGVAFLHNATKLKEVGIRFQKAASDNLFDISYDDGVLEMPQLCVREWTESLFRNLMAFEHCRPGNHQYIASYIFLMDRLIDSKQDVELLENERIIINELGGGEYIINFFKNMCKQVVVKEFYFADLCQDVEAAYQSMWRRNWQDIKRQHFDTPLKIITWVVGSVAIGLTIIQTVYGALQYYQAK
ncbi:UPF0481 protein At3g47200-like [Silene latifolia]|uniref:UPF0481 protein At3g47200-like n=1 Tax=Silene latifolia TaxID=37657 RepID=UPI003D76C747